MIGVPSPIPQPSQGVKQFDELGYLWSDKSCDASLENKQVYRILFTQKS